MMIIIIIFPLSKLSKDEGEIYNACIKPAKQL